MISRHKWKPTRSMKANWQLSSICRWNRNKSKWTRLFSSSTMQLGGKCEIFMVNLSSKRCTESGQFWRSSWSKDRFCFNSSNILVSSSSWLESSLYESNAGFHVLRVEPCIRDNLCLESGNLNYWISLARQGHLAAMILSSKRLPFFSQLDSATSWSRDSPLDDGIHLGTFGKFSKPKSRNFWSPIFFVHCGFRKRAVGIK